MPYLYKVTTESGQSYRRVGRLTIINPDNAAPTIHFDEEDCLVRQGKPSVKSPPGSQNPFAKMVDPNTVVPLVNPDTGLPTGQTTTYGAIYVQLWSVWAARAKVRDALEEAQAAMDPANKALAEARAAWEVTQAVLDDAGRALALDPDNAQKITAVAAATASNDPNLAAVSAAQAVSDSANAAYLAALTAFNAG